LNIHSKVLLKIDDVTVSLLGFIMLQVLFDHDATGRLRCYHSDFNASRYLQRFVK